MTADNTADLVKRLRDAAAIWKPRRGMNDVFDFRWLEQPADALETQAAEIERMHAEHSDKYDAWEDAFQDQHRKSQALLAEAKHRLEAEVRRWHKPEFQYVSNEGDGTWLGYWTCRLGCQNLEPFDFRMHMNVAPQEQVPAHFTAHVDAAVTRAMEGL